MKVFVFGAGASQGSQDPEGLPAVARAPLVNELFDKLYHAVAETEHGPLLHPDDLEECRKASRSEEGLEAWLTRRWSGISSVSSTAKRTAERGFFGGLSFYIRQVLLVVSDHYRSTNWYAALLRRIRDRDETVALVSFNYDTLLDQAVQDVLRTPLGTLEDYYDIRYFKPHGSINWFIPRRPDDPRVDRIESGRDYASSRRRAIHGMFSAPGPLDFGACVCFDPRDRILHSWPQICARMEGHYGYPAVLMPLTSKLFDHFYGFETRIVGESRACFSQARDVYLVGYRAADELISELLGAAPDGAPLHVVSDSPANAAEIQKRVLSKSANLRAGRMWTEGFRQFVGNYGT